MFDRFVDKVMDSAKWFMLGASLLLVSFIVFLALCLFGVESFFVFKWIFGILTLYICVHVYVVVFTLTIDSFRKKE